MVQAPVGIKCHDCARMPRSAQIRLKPERGLRAVGVAIGLGLAAGVVLSSLGGNVGFFGLIVAFGVGYGIGEAVKRASGYYRAESTGWIAAAGGAIAYLSPLALAPALFGYGIGQGTVIFQVLYAAIAAFSAYRQSS
jgi:hypothetical protein